ncbi:MAG TPA: response regulator [Chloroflexota bacterium]|nr:response regulator [Chloroflexota bacterium]
MLLQGTGKPHGTSNPQARIADLHRRLDVLKGSPAPSAEDVDLGSALAAERYILVLEDDAATADLLKSIIEEECGIATHLAATGVRALEAVAAHRPLLILVDLIVPLLDGEHFMREVRAHDPEVPFIVMSALAASELERVAALFGAPCLLKPFGIEALLDSVSDVLDRTAWA